MPYQFLQTLAVTLSLVSPTAWAGTPVTLDRLEASVNSSIILYSDVKKFRDVSRLRAQLDPLFAGTSLASQGDKSSDSDIVSFLVDENLITQQFKKSDTDVEQEINSIQNSNHLDRTGLRDALSREGYKFTDYFDLIRNSSSKRELIDREIHTKVTISDDDIKNYFYNHYSKSTTVPRSFHLQMISVSTKSYKTPAAANKVISDALKNIEKGESFSEVAKSVSDDPTAPTGGDLGTLAEDQMAPIIRDEAKKLKIGEVSKVLGGGTTGRYFILKLLDVKSSETERLDKMKDEIRAQLATAEYQHQISLWLDRQRQSAFIHRAGESILKSLAISPD